MQILPDVVDRGLFRLFDGPRHQGRSSFLLLLLRTQGKRRGVGGKRQREQRCQQRQRIRLRETISRKYPAEFVQFRFCRFFALKSQKPLQMIR